MTISVDWDVKHQNNQIKPTLLNEDYSLVNYGCTKLQLGMQILRCTGVAPITQVTHVRNKNSSIQGRSLNVISDFPYYEELLIKERIRSLWEQFLSEEFPF